MGPRKRSDDGDDVTTKHKKPNNFWAPFNTWWREHHERTGNRATVLEMREWYAQNAHLVWPPETMPTVEDMLKIAKGLRTIKQVQAYFRSYRKNLKTRKEGEPGSPESSGRKAARRQLASTRAVGAAAAGSFLAAVHHAAQHHQQMAAAAAAAAAAAVAAAASASTYTGSKADERPNTATEQLPFLEWGFTSEAAAAAAMEAVEEGGNDGDGQLSDRDGDACRAHVTTSPRGQRVPGLEMEVAREEPGHLDMGPRGAEAGARPIVQGGLSSTAGTNDEATRMSMASVNPYYDAAWQFQQHHGKPHPLLLQPAIAHRRYIRAARTSIGGNGASRPLDANNSGAAPTASLATVTTAMYNSSSGNGGAGGLQGVASRRARIQTSGGGMWRQAEVAGQQELGAVSAHPMPYGMGLQPSYPGIKKEESAFVAVGPTCGSYPQSADALTGTVWHGRTTTGGVSGEGGAGGGVSAAIGMDGGVPPPRKQLRCGDRGVVSLGGSDIYSSPSPRGAPVQDNEPLPSGSTPLRRLTHSHGGHSSAYHQPCYIPRAKAAASLGGGSGMGVMALSDGGVVYGSHAPPLSQHAHAPPAFRGATSTYVGVAGTWPPHTHAPPLPGHHHQQLYAPYHLYGYRHAVLGYPPAPPSYGYPHASHPPMPTYNVAPPYHLYGVHMSSPYGQYYNHHHLPEVSGGPGMALNNRLPERPPQGPHHSEVFGISPAMGITEQNPRVHGEEQDLHQPLRPAQSQQALKAQVTDNITAPSPAQSLPYNLTRACLQSQQPLQLAELPPPFVGGLVGSGGVETISNSDLGGLSGLSALGLEENDSEGEEAASANPHHQHLRTTQYMHQSSSRGLQNPQQQQKQSSAAKELQQRNPAQGAAQLQPQPHRPLSLHGPGEPKDAPVVAASAPSAVASVHSQPRPLAQPPRRHHSHQKCEDGRSGIVAIPAAADLGGPPSRLLDNERQQPLHTSSTGARAGVGDAVVGAAPAADPVIIARNAVHQQDDSGFTAASDGGATDGSASVYYKTPKVLAGKPLTPLTVPDTIFKCAFSDHSHEHVQQHVQHGSLAAGGGTTPVAARCAPAPYDACQTKSRAAPRPVTVQVLQEDLAGMPHVLGAGGGGGSCSLGDLASLHSPTGSLNLALLDHVPDDGGEVGMWGPCS